MPGEKDMAQVIELLLLLTNLTAAVMKATQEVSKLIEKANKQNRDLTDKEIEAVKKEGDKIIQDWQDTIEELKAKR